MLSCFDDTRLWCQGLLSESCFYKSIVWLLELLCWSMVNASVLPSSKIDPGRHQPLKCCQSPFSVGAPSGRPFRLSRRKTETTFYTRDGVRRTVMATLSLRILCLHIGANNAIAPNGSDRCLNDPACHPKRVRRACTIDDTMPFPRYGLGPERQPGGGLVWPGT